MWVKLTNVEQSYDPATGISWDEKGPVYINLDQVIAVTPTSYGCLIQTTGLQSRGSLSSGTLNYTVKESVVGVLRGCDHRTKPVVKE
jgi:hypothetical protein